MWIFAPWFCVWHFHLSRMIVLVDLIYGLDDLQADRFIVYVINWQNLEQIVKERNLGIKSGKNQRLSAESTRDLAHCAIDCSTKRTTNLCFSQVTQDDNYTQFVFKVSVTPDSRNSGMKQMAPFKSLWYNNATRIWTHSFGKHEKSWAGNTGMQRNGKILKTTRDKIKHTYLHLILQLPRFQSSRGLRSKWLIACTGTGKTRLKNLFRVETSQIWMSKCTEEPNGQR